MPGAGVEVVSTTPDLLVPCTIFKRADSIAFPRLLQEPSEKG